VQSAQKLDRSSQRALIALPPHSTPEYYCVSPLCKRTAKG